MKTDVEEVTLTTADLRSMITLKLKLPPMFMLRMKLTVMLIKLAALIAWCDIEIEFQEENTK